VGNPTAAADEFLLHHSDMCSGSPEGYRPQPQKRHSDLLQLRAGGTIVSSDHGGGAVFGYHPLGLFRRSFIKDSLPSAGGATHPEMILPWLDERD
jgi:hypothetical protein